MNQPITLFTIGFTKKSARQFFTRLRDAGVKTLIDVRLNNVSQLAAFAKRDDLEYFLDEIAGIGYVHLPELAPPKEILDAYKKKEIDWPTYEKRFTEVLRSRRVEDAVPREIFADGCLLCSEVEPEHCHRRLVAEYLKCHWADVRIEHIL